MTLATQPKENVHRATPIRRISRGVDDRGDQQVYPYSFLHTRVDQWTSCLHLCLFSTYVHGEAQGWTHFTLFINFLLCCFKICNHLHTINYDILLLSTTTTSFLHGLISVLLFLKIFTLEQTFLLFASIELGRQTIRARAVPVYT